MPYKRQIKGCWYWYESERVGNKVISHYLGAATDSDSRPPLHYKKLRYNYKDSLTKQTNEANKLAGVKKVTERKTKLKTEKKVTLHPLTDKLLDQTIKKYENNVKFSNVGDVLDDLHKRTGLSYEQLNDELGKRYYNNKIHLFEGQSDKRKIDYDKHKFTYISRKNATAEILKQQKKNFSKTAVPKAKKVKTEKKVTLQSKTKSATKKLTNDQKRRIVLKDDYLKRIREDPRNLDYLIRYKKELKVMSYEEQKEVYNKARVYKGEHFSYSDKVLADIFPKEFIERYYKENKLKVVSDYRKGSSKKLIVKDKTPLFPYMNTEDKHYKLNPMVKTPYSKAPTERNQGATNYQDLNDRSIQHVFYTEPTKDNVIYYMGSIRENTPNNVEYLPIPYVKKRLGWGADVNIEKKPEWY